MSASRRFRDVLTLINETRPLSSFSDEFSFLKIVNGALFEVKHEDITDVTWIQLNKKAITYIKMVVSDEILVDLKGLTTAFEVWEKLRATYEITTPIN